MDTGTLVVITLIVVVTVILVGEYIKSKELNDINNSPFYDRFNDITPEAAKEQKRKEDAVNDSHLDI